jgi:LmbE family N-acetylglucosaminyl deacetylase
LPIIAPEILVPKPYRAVVVATHPDEESIGLGGTIARLAMLKRPILLIAATDGCGARPGAERGPLAPPDTTSMLTTWRAVQRLGTGHTTILRTGVATGAMPRIERDLEWRLRGLLLPSDVVFATWRRDGHPDHEAIGRVASRACAALCVQLIEVPVWAWQWCYSGDGRIPWKRARRVFIEARARSVPTVPQLRTGRIGRDAAPPCRTVASPTPFPRPYEIVFV